MKISIEKIDNEKIHFSYLSGKFAELQDLSSLVFQGTEYIKGCQCVLLELEGLIKNTISTVWLLHDSDKEEHTNT